MRLFPPRRVSGRAWWGLFALFVAAPGLALSWLGLRAVRADRVEAEQQVRAQQRQVTQLADAAIQNALARLQTESTRRHAGRPDPEAAAAFPADAALVVFHRSGLVTFPGDRVYFGPFGRAPSERSALTDWPAPVARMVEEAQALEIRRRTRDAAALLARIGRAEPRLAAWAVIAAARARLHDDPAALGQLAADAWARSTGVTPSGLPAAFVAAVAGEGREGRASFVPLIRATLDGLQAGRWWLSADERRFYDGHLRTLLTDSGAAPPADARFARLAEIDQLVRQFPPSRRSGPTHVLERGGSSTYLVAWSPSDGDSDAWLGVAVDQARFASWIAPRLDTLFAGQPFGGALRDARGVVLWSRGQAGTFGWQTEPLRTLAGWDVTFGGPAAHPTFARRQWLWYAFISLPLVLLLAGIGMTAHVVRREMELARMQAEFVAAVTHEFKSPITSIRLLLERVTGGRFSSAQSLEPYYAAIGQETDRLERLVNRVLEAQRIESGERSCGFHPESLEELTAEVVRHLQPSAEAKQIRIEVDSDADLPPVAVDRTVISDAIENLIDNAIKYSRAGTRVRVRLQAVGDRVSIDVADQGIGIERDELSRVFDKFYRARRGDLQSVRGTGLGLALVKAAAEAHGGSVDVESEPGVGSRFSLTLPTQQAAGGR